MKTATTSSLEERALNLLSSGIPAIQVADILGVDSSRISQLISEEEFSAKLVAAKYEVQQKHNLMDGKLDNLEDAVLERLTDTIGSVYKPLELVRILQVVNSAKRRGSQSMPEVGNERRDVINLTMPVQIINKFTVNAQNQVMRAGKQDLITIQSTSLKNLADDASNKLTQEILESNEESNSSNGEPSAS